MIFLWNVVLHDAQIFNSPCIAISYGEVLTRAFKIVFQRKIFLQGRVMLEQVVQNGEECLISIILLTLEII